MGTIYFDESLEDRHQHPALVFGSGLIDERDLKLEDLRAFAEKNLSRNYHMGVHRHGGTKVQITLWYAALGAWKVDVRRRLAKLPCIDVWEDGFVRTPLCDHRPGTDAKCDLPREVAHNLIQRQLQSLRDQQRTQPPSV